MMLADTMPRDPGFIGDPEADSVMADLLVACRFAKGRRRETP